MVTGVEPAGVEVISKETTAAASIVVAALTEATVLTEVVVLAAVPVFTEVVASTAVVVLAALAILTTGATDIPAVTAPISSTHSIMDMASDIRTATATDMVAIRMAGITRNRTIMKATMPAKIILGKWMCRRLSPTAGIIEDQSTVSSAPELDARYGRFSETPVCR
jgi:hypothetical protein